MVQFRPGGNLTLVAIVCWPGFSDDSGVVFITFALKNLVALTLTSTNPNNRPAPKGEKCRIRGRFQHFSLTLLGVHWVMNICFWFFFGIRSVESGVVFDTSHWSCWGYVGWWILICFQWMRSVESGCRFRRLSLSSCWEWLWKTLQTLEVMILGPFSHLVFGDCNC